MNKAILLSGGMDSIALAYWQRPEIAVTVDYGQASAETEVRVSSLVAKELGIAHHVVRVDCSSLGSGDLVNKGAVDGSPSSEWWPYRNQLLITLSAMRLAGLNIAELMLASVKSDGFHRDGTTEFYGRVCSLMEYQEGEMRITCPAINMSTAELVLQSSIPKSLLFWAHSCHKANLACGNCRGCKKYIQTMRELHYFI